MRSAATRRAPAAVLVAVLATVLATVLAACASPAESGAPVAQFTETNPDGLNGAVLPEPYVVPARTLTATDAADYHLRRDMTSPVTLLFFGYTHCPDICHVVMADIASALARLTESEQARVEMLFITSDPARDDAAVLREYLDRFDPRFEGLTGDLDTIIEVARSVGVDIEEGARLPSGGYEVAHGTQVVAADDRGRASVVWTEGTSSAALAEDLRALLARGTAS